jgi:hypothetical protein
LVGTEQRRVNYVGTFFQYQLSQPTERSHELVLTCESQGNNSNSGGFKLRPESVTAIEMTDNAFETAIQAGRSF